MKNKTGDVAIKSFFGLKPKMYQKFSNDTSWHNKAKDINKNVVATISHNEYKTVLLNNQSEMKLKIIEQKIMKSTKLHCLDFMIKYALKTMDVIY